MSELRVGFAGLGRMGTPMARRLADRGLLWGVYNRTVDRATEVAAEFKVRAFENAAELSRSCNVIVTMVADQEAVHALYAAFAPSLQPGTVAIEMSTIGAQSLVALRHKLAARGGSLVDAPVSGSVAHAASGDLTLMVGGERADVDRVEPVLRSVGAKIFRLGPLGSGAKVKLAVNSIILALNQAVSEALVLAERAGVERARAYEVFAASAVAAPFVHYRRDDFVHPGAVPTAFRLDLAGKDMRLVLELADAVGLRMPQAELGLRQIMAAAAAGYGDHDVSAIAEYIRHRSSGLCAASDEAGGNLAQPMSLATSPPATSETGPEASRDDRRL